VGPARQRDRKNKALAFGAGTYDFEQLYELRKGEHFEKQNTLDVRSERDARCQQQLDVLGERLAKVNPDVLIIVGDDHHEWFLNDIQPAFSIFHGKEVFQPRAHACGRAAEDRQWRRLCHEALLSAAR
jgi:OH-DDVA oxygenase/3-O-methylgallate 3,4-dioxygenase